ncbi:hypothetical protein Micbo1qcDRAFT_164423 [Microdochium bolleyi]|uniref:DUF155 domain-containing protein n=1 Tax=Microdochium bolleyi TaxID=196109 RepID=A0A136J0K2_9PEZI|nr:hypothetical protein Micbo1qcDRAFT_164423 [Microdochium bolleyi]
MRTSLSKVAAPVARSFHSRAFTPKRPTRCFHETRLATMPRRRDFFTSNQLLSNIDRSDDVDSSSTRSLGATSNTSPLPTSMPPSSSSAKRKPTRASVAKIVRLAKPPAKRNRPVAKSTTPETTDAAEKDYRHTISAVCVAQSFDMEKVQEILRFHGFELDPDSTDFDTEAVVHARGVNNGDLFIFPSGTVVSWAVPAETLETLATKQLIRAAEFPHVNRLEWEDLDFTTDDTRETSYMRGETVVLGTKGLELDPSSQLDITLAKIAFSSGLARSPKLAVLEENLFEFFQGAKTIFNSPEGGAHDRLTSRFVLKKTGELLSLRAQLNHYSDITDQLPDMFWDSESRLEDYYNQVGNRLDVRARIADLNRKIDYAHENVSVLREMTSEKHGTRLEWIIIILISVEVLFELRRVYKEEFVEKTAEGHHD